MASSDAPSFTTKLPRVLIVSENISMQKGGEASLGFYYAKLFQKRGVEVWMACHERVKDELHHEFADHLDHIHLIPDTKLQVLLFNVSRFFPARIREMIFDQLIHFSTQSRLRKVAIELGRQGKIDVVLEPAPITPRGLSFMYDVGVPVAIGPLCGGLEFPPAFRHMDSKLTRLTINVSRRLSNFANWLIPGKRTADVLMVANKQTAAALPNGCRGQVVTLIESGVDLTIWHDEPDDQPATDLEQPVHFVFSGRFVDWKGIAYLIKAFQIVAESHPNCILDLVGGGELFDEVKAIIDASPQLTRSVRLHGWVSRPEAAKRIRETDVFVMPSLRECGGTAILEALALGKPVVATNWAGPGIYVNASCGILVDPSSEAGFVQGLADAMIRLANSPELRERLGEGGRARVHELYLDWDDKAERVLEILSALVDKRPIPEGHPVNI